MYLTEQNKTKNNFEDILIEFTSPENVSVYSLTSSWIALHTFNIIYDLNSFL